MNMKKMLVGVDGSPVSLEALTWTAAVCDRAGLACVAARVFAPTQAELGPDLDVTLHVRQREELDDWCRRLPGAQPAAAVLLDGDPPKALMAEADACGADILVVGRHSRNDLRHPDVGSVARALAQHTNMPLAILPGAEHAALSHIVIGVDGSDASLAAVDVAGELAYRLDVGVTAVLAFDLLVELVPDTDPDSWRTRAEDAVRRWTAPMSDAGVAVEVDIDRHANPVTAIVRALGAHPGSLACLGAHELNEVTGMRLGRKALHVLRHTDSPILIVPVGAEATPT